MPPGRGRDALATAPPLAREQAPPPEGGVAALPQSKVPSVCWGLPLTRANSLVSSRFGERGEGVSRKTANHAEEVDRIMPPSAPHRMDRIILREFSLDRIYRMNRTWRKTRILSSRQCCHLVEFLSVCALSGKFLRTVTDYRSRRNTLERAPSVWYKLL